MKLQGLKNDPPIDLDSNATGSCQMGLRLLLSTPDMAGTPKSVNAVQDLQQEPKGIKKDAEIIFGNNEVVATKGINLINYSDPGQSITCMFCLITTMPLENKMYYLLNTYRASTLACAVPGKSQNSLALVLLASYLFEKTTVIISQMRGRKRRSE